MEARRTPGLLDGVILASFLAVLLSVTYAYVTAERFFYYWDDAVFHDLAWRTASAFRRSWLDGLREVHLSFRQDYNALYAIPLSPLLWLFGDSRLAYELSLAVAYLCPFMLAVGALTARLAPEPTRTHFWTAAWIALLVPMAWVPTLRGYPDAGAAALVVVALLVYLRRGADGSAWDAALVGILLGLSVVFRRHFAYSAAAFVAAGALYEAGVAITRRRRGDRPPANHSARLASRLMAGGLAAALTAAAFGQGFVFRFLSYDFPGLYRAYEEPPSLVLRWYLAAYGWAAAAAAALGILLGVRTGALDRRRTAFVVLFGAVSTIQWLLVVRQLGEQYTLHFTPLIVVGLSALLWTIWRIEAPLPRALARTCFTLLLLTNAMLGLSTTELGKGSFLRGAFAGGWMPLRRWDYDALIEFVEYLRRNTKPDEGIFVAASSRTLNPDLLRHAEWARHGHDHARLEVLRSPAIDSRDFYPLGELLEAQHVVLVRPLQLHLRPEVQQVVKVVDDLFAGQLALARDFAPRPESFSLEGGATLSLYSRSRPTDLRTALQTLDLIREHVATRPGMQPDWIVVSRRFPSWLTRNPDGSATWTAHPSRHGDAPSTIAAYIGRPFDRGSVAGTLHFLDDRCRGAALSFSALDAGGRPDERAAVQRRPGEDGRFRSGVSAGSGRLLLSVLDYASEGSIDYCLLEVESLVASPTPPES